jgi:hypothetical protein
MKNNRDSGKQRKSVAGFEAVSQLWTRLGRRGLPSETLKSGSSERGVSAGGAKGTVSKVSAPFTHLSKVPLQVFSGETAPTLRIKSPTVTEWLRFRKLLDLSNENC